MPQTQDLTGRGGGRGSPLATDDQGQLIDVSTGQVIRPGDPNWNPEYSQVLASQPPPGQHWVFPNGFDASLPNGGGHLESNSLPWYEDPALLGAIGVAGIGAGLAAAGAGAGEGAAGAGGVASGSSLPSGIYGTAGSAAAPSAASAAAPLAGTALTTGGKVLDAATAVSQGLGPLGSGLVQGDVAGAQIGNQYGRNLIDLYSAENNASRNQLAQEQFLKTQLPAAEANQSVRGDILSSARDVSLSGVPSGIPNIQISGGLRPSMFSPTTRSLGLLQSANALSTAKNPPTFTNPIPPTIPAPTIPGAGTKALLTTGITGNILQRLRPFLNSTQPNVNTNGGAVPGPDTGYG